MNVRLRPLAEQTLVITGGSSGIGLVTAREAARRGARVVLAGPDEQPLAAAVSGIRRDGGRAIYQVTDVSDSRQVAALAERAVAECARIDTWVNNAAAPLERPLMHVPVDDLRQQVEVNYWGPVYGSRAAVPRMREQGGAIINVATALADRGTAPRGHADAASHALEAFTDALRMELEGEGVPIAVTLVKPANIDPALLDQARTCRGGAWQRVPRRYAPEAIAEVILQAAQRPNRQVMVGSPGTALRVARAVGIAGVVAGVAALTWRAAR